MYTALESHVVYNICSIARKENINLYFRKLDLSRFTAFFFKYPLHCIQNLLFL